MPRNYAAITARTTKTNTLFVCRRVIPRGSDNYHKPSLLALSGKIIAPQAGFIFDMIALQHITYTKGSLLIYTGG